METALAKPINYPALLSDLKTLITQGQQSALNAVNAVRLDTYWRMGAKMNPIYDQLDVTAAAEFTIKLSEDLNIDKSLVYRIMQFNRLWPDGVPKVGDVALSWTHHIELLSLKDEKERQFYLAEASTQGWGRSVLRKAIDKNYYITAMNDSDDGKTPKLKRDDNPLYVYKTIVENVVDGDTLLVRIDLGFNVWVNQRIRFRGINTGELTEKGVPIANAEERAKAAKIFVQEKLKDIPFIVVKTYKTDMYGRYIADVFYHPTLDKKEDVATKGFFLNADLVKSGLADVMI